MSLTQSKFPQNVIKVFAKKWLSLFPEYYAQKLKNHYLTVFMFHSVSDYPSKFQQDFHINFPLIQYFEFLNWLKRNFYVVPTGFTIQDVQNLDQPIAMLTFDDAWKSSTEAIRIATEQFGLPCTFFVNMGTVHSGVDFAAAEIYLSINKTSRMDFLQSQNIIRMLKENSQFKEFQGETLGTRDLQVLEQNKLLTIGNHGFYHFRSSNLDLETFKQNVRLNEEQIMKLSNSDMQFAYPFGSPDFDFTEEQTNYLLNAGYKPIFATGQKLSALNLSRQKFHNRIALDFADKSQKNFQWRVKKSLLFSSP